jgi:hypothetical protein
VLHSGDFKIDLTPVDHRRCDLARLGELAKGPGIRLLMSDSTNAEEAGFAPSETSVGTVLNTLFAQQRGKRSSPPASPATSTASSRSSPRRSPTDASSPRSA